MPVGRWGGGATNPPGAPDSTGRSSRTTATREFLSALPSLTLVYLASPGEPGLEQTVAGLVPTCAEYGVELLVVGGKASARSGEEGVRYLPSGPGESALDLRGRALGEATGDIVLFVTGEQVGSLDIAELLGHRAGIVSVDLPEGGEAAASASQSVS